MVRCSISPTGSPSRAASARSQGVLVARPRREASAKASWHLRVWLQGLDVTPATAPKGGSSAAAKALHGNPYDGHTLPRHRRSRKAHRVAARRIHGDKAIAATTIPTGSRSGSAPVRPSPKPSAARAASRRRGACDRPSQDGHRSAATISTATRRINAVLAAAGYNFSLLRHCSRTLRPHNLPQNKKRTTLALSVLDHPPPHPRDTFSNRLISRSRFSRDSRLIQNRPFN